MHGRNRPPDPLSHPVHVQDQPGPQRLARLQAIGSLEDYSCLVIQALDGTTALPAGEVGQNAVPVPLVHPHEGTPVHARGLGLLTPVPDLRLCRLPVDGGIEDVRQLPTQLMDHAQRRQLLEQRLQGCRLLRSLVGRATAELPHPRPELLPLRLAQLRLMRAGHFFRRSSATARSFWATWKRSMTDWLLGSRSSQAPR